jgi:hypothetical protein
LDWDSLFYLETDLRVSGGTITHHQERKQLYLRHLVFDTPLTVICRYRGRVGTGLSVLWQSTAHSNQFQLFHDSGMMMGDGITRNT